MFGTSGILWLAGILLLLTSEKLAKKQISRKRNKGSSSRGPQTGVNKNLSLAVTEDCLQFSCAAELDEIGYNTTPDYIVCKYENSNSANASSWKTKQDLLSRVNSAKELQQFLDTYIDWNIDIYMNQNFNGCSVFNATAVHHNAQLAQCYTNINDKVFRNGICSTCKCENNNKSKDQFMEKHYALFVVMGIIAVFGNSVVICNETKTLIKNFKKPVVKERKIYSYLVLNLCVADLLMGIYILVFPSAAKFDFLDVNLCAALGIISTTSIQVSATVLIMISAYRLYGVVKPYELVHYKLTFAMMCVSWAFWFFVTSIPVLKWDILGISFLRRVKFDSIKFPMNLHKMVQAFEFLVNATNKNNFTDVISVMDSVVNHTNVDVLLQTIDSFGFVDIEQESYDVIGYYFKGGACTVDFQISNSNNWKYFSTSLLAFNVSAFAFIFVACLVIFRHIDFSGKKPFFSCKANCSKFSKANEVQDFNNLQAFDRKTKSQNKKVYLRLLLVVVTDFICWIPICTIGIVYLIMSFNTTECNLCKHKEFRSWFSIVVMASIPVNSVINPYIYSSKLWKRLYLRLKSRKVH